MLQVHVMPCSEGLGDVDCLCALWNEAVSQSFNVFCAFEKVFLLNAFYAFLRLFYIFVTNIL